VTVKLQKRTQNNVNHAIVVVVIMLKVLTALHSKHYTHIYHSYTVIHIYIYLFFFRWPSKCFFGVFAHCSTFFFLFFIFGVVCISLWANLWLVVVAIVVIVIVVVVVVAVISWLSKVAAIVFWSVLFFKL